MTLRELQRIVNNVAYHQPEKLDCSIFIYTPENQLPTEEIVSIKSIDLDILDRIDINVIY